MSLGVSVHTVFPRYFHRNDLEFVTIRDKIERAKSGWELAQLKAANGS